MNNRKIIYFSLTAGVALFLIFGLIILSNKRSQELRMVFLDVGQGDSVLISSGDNQILIDSGKNGKVALEKLGKFMPFWDRTIEAIIITHPDNDHYGGFSSVLDFYKIETVISTDAQSTAEQWSNLKDKIVQEKSNQIRSTYGTVINFSNGAKLTIIYPLDNKQEVTEDKNDMSVVAKLEFGENKFLLTGDLSAKGEAELLKNNIDISADVLKIGHHGSRYSTSAEFLAKVNPRDAVISVGKNNSYGHPHQEVLGRLKARLVRVWRTDEDGNIEYRCKNANQLCQAFKY